MDSTVTAAAGRWGFDSPLGPYNELVPGVAQFGQSAVFGRRMPQVQILPLGSAGVAQLDRAEFL